MTQPTPRTVVAALLVVGCALLACDKSSSSTPVPDVEPSESWSEPEAPAVEAPPPEPTPLDRLQAAETLAQALAVTQPLMKDSVEAFDPATAALAVWATKNLYWSQLQALPKTEYALVMKDSNAERGKRLCARGTITEIAKDQTVPVSLYNGGLMTPGLKIIRFAAVRSTGTLVANKPARLCGVVTGRYSYANTIGGITHAVFLVGMFDLPANRKE